MSPEKKYTLTWVVTVAVSLLAIGGTTALVDPYRIWHTDPPWKVSTPLMTKVRFSQPLAVAWQRPDLVLLGSSGVYNGMSAPSYLNDPTSTLCQPGLTVFNHGVPGLCMEEAVAYVQHILDRTPARRIVLGIDFFMFDPYMQPRPGFQTDIGETGFLWREIPTSLFSFAALSDATVVLRQDLLGTKAAAAASALEHIAQDRGLAFYEKYYTYWRVKRSQMPVQPSGDAMRRLVDVARLCKANRVDLVLYFAPVHASILDAIYERGDWQTFQTIKARVQALAEREEITLWDFATYNEATTADLLDRTAPYFSDPIHYRPKLGRQILANMGILDSGGSDPAMALGIQLAPNVASDALRRMRQDEAAWGAYWEKRRLGHAYEIGLRSGQYEAAARLRRYELHRNAQQQSETLRTADGVEVAILRPGHPRHGVVGVLDRIRRDQVHVRIDGWAVDAKNKKPIGEIVVFADGQQYHGNSYWLWERQPRPKLGQRLGIPALVSGGFSLAVPYQALAGRDVRIFAISGPCGIELTRAPLTPLPIRRQLEAISIACRPRYRLQHSPKSGDALLSAADRRIPILGSAPPSHGIVGVVDRVQRRGARVCFDGWVVDTKQARLIDDLVVLVDGQQFGAASRTTWQRRPRPNPARKLGLPHLVENGYSISIPLNTVCGANRQVRIFAISGDRAMELTREPNLPVALKGQLAGISATFGSSTIRR